MTSPTTIRHPEPWSPTTYSRGQVEAMVSEAEIPPLLATLARLLGDDRLIPASLRPPRAPAQAEIVPQGGMSAEQLADARRIATAGLMRYLAGERSTTPVDLERIVEYLTNGQADDYADVLRHELGERHESQSTVDLSGLRVAVIGAGVSGLAMSYNLSLEDVDHVVFEKSGDVGGTWNENRYPGCRLDTSNFAYSFSFAQKADWTDQFSTRADIWEYMRGVAEQYGVLGHVRLNTRVESLSLDERTGQWQVTTIDAGGTRHTEAFDYVVSAVGQLNVPKMPDIPGIEDFSGQWCHSAEWSPDVEVSGKRVAVIGTGASAFQIVPTIVDEVESLVLFQRSAPWMMPTPGYQDAIKPGMAEVLRLIPEYGKWLRFWQFWLAAEGRMSLVLVDEDWPRAERGNTVSEANARFREQLLEHISNQYLDRPDLAAKVIPTYPPGGKRLLRDDGAWARALKAPNAELVVDPIERVTDRGILLRTGRLVECDVIVYATGFAASDFLSTLEVTGTAGADLHEVWAGEARAYKGVCVPGFPGLHLIYGPNTGLVVTGSAIFMSECSVEYSIELMREAVRRGGRPVDVSPEAFAAYNAELAEANRLRAWGVDGFQSWYKNAAGTVTQNWPFPLSRYYQDTHTLDTRAHPSTDPPATPASKG